MRRIVFALPILLVALPDSAMAHAKLIASSPPGGGTVAMADTIRLRFNEGIAIKLSGADIQSPAGPVEHGPPTGEDGDRTMVIGFAKPLPPAAYHVKWHVVSADSHKVQGSFDFTVKP